MISGWKNGISRYNEWMGGGCRDYIHSMLSVPLSCLLAMVLVGKQLQVAWKLDIRCQQLILTLDTYHNLASKELISLYLKV